MGSTINTHRLTVVLAPVVLFFLEGCSDILKPDLPVVVTHRQSLVGEGLVGQFNNQTNSQLTIFVVLENHKKNQRKEGHINIPANGQEEIGWLEGWKFESGETVTISHPSYKTKTWRIP